MLRTFLDRKRTMKSERTGLGFLDGSISDKSQWSLGRIAARGDDDETTETEPFASGHKASVVL